LLSTAQHSCRVLAQIIMLITNSILVGCLVAVAEAGLKCLDGVTGNFIGIHRATPANELAWFGHAVNPVLCHEGTYFSEAGWNNSAKRTEILSRVNNINARVLLYWLGGLGTITDPANFWFSRAFTATFTRRAKKIDSANINAITPRNCYNIRFLAPYLNEATIKQTHADCASNLMVAFQQMPVQPGRTPIGKMSSLVSAFAHANPSSLVNYLSVVHVDGFKWLGDNSFGAIVKKEAFCAEITDIALGQILKMKSKAKLLTAECVAALPDAALVGTAGPDVGNASASFFAKVTKTLGPEFIQHATTEQIAKFGTGVKEADKPCSNMVTASLTEKNVAGLTPKCFSGAVEAHTDNVKLGERWKKVNTVLFQGMDDRLGDCIAALESDWEHMTTANKAVFFNKVDHCGSLPAAAVGESTVVGADCFGAMESAVQSAVIEKAKPAVDFLRHATSAKADAWSATEGPKQNGETHSGIAALLVLHKRQKNMQFFKHLGAASDDQPCAAIKDMKTFEELKAIYSHFPRKCMAAVNIDVSDDELKTLDPNLYGVLKMPQFEKLVEKWETAKAPLLANMVKGGSFCREVTADVVNIINADALRSVDAECVVDMTDRSGLEEKALVAFSEGAFRLITGSDLSTFKYTVLTAKQFGQMGDDVVDRATAAPANVQAADLDERRLSHVTEKFMTALNSEAYKGIDTAKELATIPADSMVGIKKSQGQNIPVAVLKTMDPARIAKFGLKVQGEQSPLSLFTDEVKKGMSAPQLAALEARKKAAERAASGPSLEASVFSIIVALSLGYVLALL